jgi:hypothetical protein
MNLIIDSEGRLRRKLYDNFPVMNFPFICSNIPAAPAYGVYISQLIRYFRACGSYQDFLDRGLLLTRKLLNQGFLLVKLKSSNFTVATMTWLTVMEYLCYKWPRICSTSRSFHHSRIITGFVTRLTRRVTLVEQELLIPPEYLSSPSVLSGIRVTRSLVLCVYFVDPFVFFLLAIVLSVLLRYTDSDYPFGIFKLFTLQSRTLPNRKITPAPSEFYRLVIFGNNTLCRNNTLCYC